MGTEGQSLFLRELVNPWYASLQNPAEAQAAALKVLLEGYSKTSYGKEHGAADAGSFHEYQARFPITSYLGLTQYLASVRDGNYLALLPEPPEHWVMTRGTTGKSKVIPTTQSHLSQILLVGARVIVNFALRRDDISVLEKGVLNLNFPSRVGVMNSQSGERSYGYSSGTYARLNPSLGAASLVPPQEKIDELGGGITTKDWHARFELVYQEAKSSDIGCLMGVTSMMTAFASYLKKAHGILPRQLWHPLALFCTSVPKIQTRWAPTLRYLYGTVPLVEMYTATEGVFAQQLDEWPYVSPNYDIYLFEVRIGKGVKLLHEMRPGEWGSLVISSNLFPRYEIGDYVESVGKNYYRVFGRRTARVALEHVLFNLFTGRFV